MLNGIPKIIPPDLLKILCEMGHGDEIVIADANFPSASIGNKVIYLNSCKGTDVLDAVLKLIPPDTYQDPFYLMDKVPGDKVDTPIWNEYKSIAQKHSDADFKFLDRFAFYEKAKDAYAVIATGEDALYANIIVKKGVI